YGLATAARNLDVRSDQSILTLADQFPSNIYVWRDLAAQTGAHVQTVGDAETNQSLSDQILSAIGPKTAIVACPQVRWTDGARLDLEAIGARARDVGAALVLDLSQSCGAMPFDVRTVKPDFAVCVGYKWLLGPYSAGFMYAAPHRRGGVPLEHNWISREGAADFTKLTEYTDRFAPGAERYDMGERSNFALLPALEASLDLLLDFGIDAIEATLAEKTAGLSDALEEIGLPCPPEAERGAHYLGATLPETAPGDLVQRLAALDVHVSRRANCLRITPHIYNTQDDLDRCIAALLDTLAVKS
ncbi:MAG: aminotransferase class V-fold PLP-dependent enzyme, partial [Pseudomonadota bacterium]